jgi:hypothetical protein
MLVQALLGISANAPDNRLAVDRPCLPDWLGEVEIRDLCIGPARVALSFNRAASGGTGFSLLEHQGDVQVMMLT